MSKYANFSQYKQSIENSRNSSLPNIQSTKREEIVSDGLLDYLDDNYTDRNIKINKYQ